MENTKIKEIVEQGGVVSMIEKCVEEIASLFQCDVQDILN